MQVTTAASPVANTTLSASQQRTTLLPGWIRFFSWCFIGLALLFFGALPAPTHRLGQTGDSTKPDFIWPIMADRALARCRAADRLVKPACHLRLHLIKRQKLGAAILPWFWLSQPGICSGYAAAGTTTAFAAASTAAADFSVSVASGPVTLGRVVKLPGR